MTKVELDISKLSEQVKQIVELTHKVEISVKEVYIKITLKK